MGENTTDGTVSVLLGVAGSALRARVRAVDAAAVERALTAVQDQATATVDLICATSTIRPVGEHAEGNLEIETTGSVSRRALRRISILTGRGMARLGYRLDREVVVGSGQVVSVYTRNRRVRA